MRAALAACLFTVACALHAESNPAPAMRAAAQNLLTALPQALLEALSDAQGRETVFSASTFRDIVTGTAEKVVPLEAIGILAARLDAAQRDKLMQLIQVYADTFEPALAAARMARVRSGGVDSIRFGWAGSTQRGRPHYYRVQGPRFLIEYDASQNDGNHSHTVWRDFEGDFGRDLLREHYAAAPHRH